MPTLDVASFNAHWCVGRRGGEVDLLRVCKELDADVVCLQEVWRRSDGRADHEQVAEELGYSLVETRVPRDHNNTAPPEVRAVDGDRSWWGIALLSRVPIRSTTDHALGSVVGDAGHRMALRAELDVDGAPFGVVCAHLTWRIWGIPKHLSRLRPLLSTGPGFVGGDFNMWGPVVSAALPGWRRAVKGRTWPAPRAMHQLDHLLVPDGVEVASAQVGSFNGSDHLPIRASLRF
jgi:endonuclease/exonuclease/phosphatase family metal-dependent hydrolase